MAGNLLDAKKAFIEEMRKKAMHPEDKSREYVGDVPGTFGSVVDVALIMQYVSKEELFRLKAMEVTLEVLKRFGPTNVEAIGELYDLLYNKLTKNGTTRQELRQGPIH